MQQKSRLSFALIMFVSACVGGCDWFGASMPALEEGYDYLFDGKTLTGWHKIGGGATFAVKGNAIVGEVGPGDNTFLRTDREFGDFILKMQVKFDEPGNSGVLFRAQQRNAKSDNPGRAFGYQYELDPSDRAWSGGIYDEARRGWLYDLTDNAEARSAFKRDDWNDISIEAVGGSIKTTLNGVPAAELADALDLSGFIGLQVHAGEQGVIRWRAIRIKELGQHEWQTDGLAEADAWKASGGEIAFKANDLTVKLEDSATARLTSRRQFSDFALRFDVPACMQNATLTVREDDAENGVQIHLSGRSVNLSAPGKGEDQDSAGEIELENPKTIRFNLASIGQDLTANVNGQLLGRLHGGLPERGKLSIEATPCAGENVAINNIEWLDLQQKPTEKLFYQTLETPAAPALSAEQAIDSFRLAPGFKIELVAAEPLIAAPVAMAWDEDGRLFVVEMRGFMPDAYGDGQDEVKSRVVMLEDTDADGKMDESTVVLDRLTNPRALAVLNQGILIAEPPNLWLCRKQAGYTVATLCKDKIRIGDYGVSEGERNIEHMENALLPGLDNWYYSANSSRRLKVVGDQLIEDATVGRGQWGLTKDNEGRIFHNNNSVFINGDLFPAEYVLPSALIGEVAGINAAVSMRDGETEQVFSIRVNPGVNRAYLEGTLKTDGRLAAPTSVSGLTYYRGGAFPDTHSDSMFVPEPAANVVAQFRLSEQGIAVHGEHITYPDEDWGAREFLASTDERFRPVDAAVGPDGALYIIDMYRGIIQDQAFMTDELREQVFARGLDKPIDLGRIWRITHSENPVEHESPQLSHAPAGRLIKALSHPNGWMRDTAQRLLAAQPSSSAALKQLAASGNAPGASHALWTLHAQGKLDRDTLLAALAAGESSVQLQALRAGSNELTLADVLAQIKVLPKDNDKLQQQLVFNLAPHNELSEARLALLDVLGSKIKNPYFSEAVINSITGTELIFLLQLLQDKRWQTASDSNAQVIKQLSTKVYVSLRGDLSSSAAAPKALQQLLNLIAQQRDSVQWRQIAMLQGLQEVSQRDGFTPARLAEVPPLFNDSSIDENNPLWEARLQGRRAFTWPGDELAAGLKPLGPTQLAQLEKGKALFNHCAACHGANGRGLTGLAPTLVGTKWVLGPPEWLTRIVLHGMSGEIEIDGKKWDSVMPGHGAMPVFDDESVAGLLTYLRRSWGNTKDPVDVNLIAQVREETAGRDETWTAAELEAVPYSRGLERFAGKYKLSFIKFTVTVEPDALHLKVPMYGGGPMQQIDETTFVGNAGGQNIKVQFEVAADGSVPAMIVDRDGQKMPAERIE